MEYCNEGTLWSIAQQGLTEQMIRHYTRDLLKAVFALHDRGIVHRDIKGERGRGGEGGSGRREREGEGEERDERGRKREGEGGGVRGRERMRGRRGRREGGKWRRRGRMERKQRGRRGRMDGEGECGECQGYGFPKTAANGL